MSIALYSDPITSFNFDEVWFYHKMSLPTYGEVGTGWDHRGDVDGYLGNHDFKGKRVLDVGAGSGFLTFEMENRGAEVVSFDLGSGADWDVVPHYRNKDSIAAMRKRDEVAIEKQKAAYWFAHADLGSKARAHYGSVYDLPEELGAFDVAFYGMILTHLRDPFQALYSGAKLTREAIIVSGIYSPIDTPSATFRPHPDKAGNLDVKGWWHMSVGTLRSMLGVLGFEVVRVVESDALVTIDGVEEKRVCQTLVAINKSLL